MPAVTALAVDPAGLRGLWLRARSGPLRDRVVQALAALPLPQRRLHPGVDDATLYGGVDLSATLAHGQLVRAAGLLATPAALILTMAERCPAGLAARLARVLDDPGFCLVALDEGAEPDEALAPALADRLALFLDLDGIAAADTFPLDLPPEDIDLDTPLGAFGLGSLAGMKLIGSLEQQFGLRLSPTLVFEHPTIAELALAIAAIAARGEAAHV